MNGVKPTIGWRVPIDDRDWLFVATPVKTRRQPISLIFAVVGEAFGIDPFELEVSRKRLRVITWPRQIALHLMAKLSPFGSCRIARLVRLDPKTVRHAIKIVAERRASDPRVEQLVCSLMWKAGENQRKARYEHEM